MVVEIRPTAVELDCAGRSLLAPNSQPLDVVVEREHGGAEPEA